MGRDVSLLRECNGEEETASVTSLSRQKRTAISPYACRKRTGNRKDSMTEKTPRDRTLNAYLRYDLSLPGTKAMCREGGCGSCVVMVRAKRQTSGVVETFSVNSCLVLVFSCQGWDITTIEGAGNRLKGYSEIQKRISAFNATQCGYCTPGWAMHLASLQDKNMTMAELERAFGSNTCRCTGFRPILDTVKSFAVDASPQLCQRIKDIEDMPICKNTKRLCERKCSIESEDSDWSIVNDMSIRDVEVKSLQFAEGKRFFKVYAIGEIFNLLQTRGENSYMLIDGNTGKGVYETFEYPDTLIDISDVKELKGYSFDQNLILGANISIEDCMTLFQKTSATRLEFSYLAEFAKHLELVAHLPIRKIGSLAGNLMLKHEMPAYQSDIFLLLESVGATLTVQNSQGEKQYLNMIDFLSFNMAGMIIVNIELPPLSSSHVYRSYKIMPRHQNALAIVNAAFLVKLEKNIVKEITIVYGNISDKFVHATNTEQYLIGKNVFDNTTLQKAIQSLKVEVQPVPRPPEPSPACRKKIAIGLFYKFILNIAPPAKAAARYRSGGIIMERPVSSGTQDYQTDPALYPLNHPAPKYEAIIQSSGEAEFANDLPNLPRQVFGTFVLSTVHSGEVDQIDTVHCLNIPGVLAIYTVKDIPGKNSFTFPGIQLQTEDEEILATKIKFYGQPIAILVAESEELAASAAKQVKVTYKNVGTTPPVLTIDQAKTDSKRYAPGDSGITPKGKGTNVKKVIKGKYEIEAQYHYYIEPISSVVVPVDRGYEVYDSSQWLDLTQIAVAQALGISESEVLVKVRRVGGAFGGKISRNAQACGACAVVARNMDRPCRFVLPMQTNMEIAGRRLPCQCEYEVGVDDDGKIQYLNALIVEDDGCSHNENILSYTAGGFPNCYNTDYFTLKTAAVLTDKCSNTFARAPGTSEGIACIEQIMEHIANTVNKDPIEVRKINMRTEDNDLPELIDLLKKESDYDKRNTEIQQFNEANRWMKKALNISVMSFPVEFYGNYSALVSIYRGDGSVTVTTGGVEMGQGVNTKVAQVCAYELGIPLEKVSILPHYSFAVANNVFSGSSIVSESVCYAVIKACEIITKRLQPLKDEMTNPAWEALIKKAGEEQVDLTALYMMSDKDPSLSSYSAFAVAILEVQLDVLIGRYEILRADILEDVGLSANPLIDVGQLEGGYIQGLGYHTSEKLVFDEKTGKLLTNRSLTYHVPLTLDIPIDFRVKFRYNSKNPKGVLGAKAVGEMGICTSQGIGHVLRQCIYESRKDSGYDTTHWINIEHPVDTESILKALDTKLEEFLITET